MIAPMLIVYPSSGAPGTGVKPVWIDLLQPTPEERDHVASEYGLRIPSHEALQEIESSSRLRADGHVLTLSMPLTVSEERVDQLPVPLGFIVSPSLLVSIRFIEVHGFADVRARLEKDVAHPADSTAVFAALIESMVDYRADLLEGMSAQVAAVSKRVFVRHLPRTRRVVLDGSLRERLAAVIARQHYM